MKRTILAALALGAIVGVIVGWYSAISSNDADYLEVESAYDACLGANLLQHCSLLRSEEIIREYQPQWDGYWHEGTRLWNANLLSQRGMACVDGELTHLGKTLR